ncbi:MAG: N-acetylmuramoyl-L-alanine amidase [Rhizobiaceae bacterium]
MESAIYKEKFKKKLLMRIIRLYVAYIALTLFSVVFAQAASQPELMASALRITGDINETRIEIEFDKVPQIEARLLSSPNRLVLDMPQALIAVGNAAPPAQSLVGSFRSGLMQEGRSRIVMSLKKPISYEAPTISPSADGRSQIFSINIKQSSDAEFAKFIQDQLLTTSSTAGGKKDRIVQGNSNQAKPFTLVIDPGHGGIDGGATGERGLIEKAVTLQFAKELQTELERTSQIKVFLTRTDDRFIALDERVKIARQLSADLFISIHADTIGDNSLRGATVYTLSEKASDEVSRKVAQQENLSDAIGGVEVEVEDKTVADILIDLTRRETNQHSVGFARSAVEALQKKTILIHNPHRSAGFRVLRAADIPSVLVELGYLSNVEDEKQIKDPVWRQGIVVELARAIEQHSKMWLIARQ